jgi:hypothetical protein
MRCQHRITPHIRSQSYRMLLGTEDVLDTLHSVFSGEWTQVQGQGIKVCLESHDLLGS